MSGLVVGAALLVNVTGWVPSAGGTNCWGDCSLTYSGLAPGPSVLACGPGWKLGTVLYLEGRYAVCGDRFGEPPGDLAVDLYFGDLASARAWGGAKAGVEAVYLGWHDLADGLPDFGWYVERDERRRSHGKDGA